MRKIPTWVWWLAGGILAAAATPAVVGVVASALEEARLNRLRPEVAEAVRKLRAFLTTRGIGLFIGSTRRTPEEQAKLVAAGKSANPFSWHQLGRAVDVYPLGADGKPDFSGGNLDAIRSIAVAAEAMGFRQLAFNPDGSKRYITGSKGPIWDSGHIELHGPHATLAAARAAEGKVIA